MVQNWEKMEVLNLLNLSSTQLPRTEKQNSINRSITDIFNLNNLGWIPLATLITADLMQPLGISPVLDIIASELFPTEIRTQALGITRSSYYSFSAFATMIFPKLKEYLGLYGVFFCFSAMSALCTFWGFLKIPETRGKSLIKVEEMMFEKNRKAK